MCLVKPDATPEEVRAVVNDESGGQIFSQAVSGHSMHSDIPGQLELVDELKPLW